MGLGLVGVQLQGRRTMTGQQLANVIAAARESLPRERELTSNDINPLNQTLASNPDLAPFRSRIKKIEKDAREAGFDSKFDWPENAKQGMRELLSEAAMVEPEILEHYPGTYQRYFGPLDWEPIEPPDVDGLEISWQATPRQVTVIDGDTLRVQTSNGDLRVRVIGINAPEQGQDGYLESRDSLRAALDDTQEIVFGLYRPDLFGTSQEVSPDGSEKRLIAWVYLDGTPYYDPASFTATNPAGIGVGGDPVDVVQLLRQRREERLNSGTE